MLSLRQKDHDRMHSKLLVALDQLHLSSSTYDERICIERQCLKQANRVFVGLSPTTPCIVQDKLFLVSHAAVRCQGE